jgi:death-on-curing protein
MIFLNKRELIKIHKLLINSFGGTQGLLDNASLESAITAVINRAYYANANIAVCAAAYAYHITQAHAFIDGNKRIAAAASEIFIEINGKSLNATNDDIYKLFMSIASGKKSRDEVEKIFSEWLI